MFFARIRLWGHKRRATRVCAPHAIRKSLREPAQQVVADSMAEIILEVLESVHVEIACFRRSRNRARSGKPVRESFGMELALRADR